MLQKSWVWLGACAAALALSACSEADDAPPREAELREAESRRLDHTHRVVVLEDAASVTRAFGRDVASFVRDEPFRQVGFLYSTAGEALEYRVRSTDGAWSQWRRVELTWREAGIHVGRALLDVEALELQVRGAEGLRSAQIEFFDQIVARTDLLTRDLPKVGERRDDGMVTRGQQVAPRSLVIPRAEWGARDPDRVCGSAHDPYRMSIHHTYRPSSDGSDAAATMRGIQAYHIDTRGWCDIGYHFVVSQAGDIYQGRSSEQRTGAHVGGQNSGNIGICLIGDFTTQTPRDVQLDAASRMVGWVHQTYAIPLDRNSVRGHREWPGQSTSCPGDNLLTRVEDILSRAANGGSADWAIDVEVNWLDAQNFYTQGAGADLADALPGEAVEAEILITNRSPEPIRNVWAGYLVEEPYLRAADYTIYTDHPAYDRATWQINDANDAEENPAADALGETGKLNLYAFSPGETKRIHVALEALRYSVGLHDHPDVRGWVQHAEGAGGAVVYGDQDSWEDAVETNELDGRARDYAELDVLSRDTWLFDDTSDAANLEGWMGKPDADVERLILNTDEGALALKVAGGDARIISPAWTAIDADAFEQLVLNSRSHDGEHTRAIYWAREGESFSEERVVRFRVDEASEFVDLVVPIGEHPLWSGEVTKLRIDLLDRRAPEAEDSGWYDVGAIYFQSAQQQATSDSAAAFVDQAPVVLLDVDGQPGPQPQPDDDPMLGEAHGEADGEVAVNEGCAATGLAGGAPAGTFQLLLLVVLGGLGLRRRRE